MAAQAALGGGLLVARVVGVACQDCTGAVDLFGEHEPGELVGHGDGAKGE